MVFFSSYLCVSIFIIWALLIKILYKSETDDNEIEIVKFLNKNDELFCILRPCKYLSLGAYITIYYSENNFETYFATGVVSNVQTNNLIQVKLLNTIEDNTMMNSAINNNLIFLNSIIIKPIITNKFLEECN